MEEPILVTVGMPVYNDKLFLDKSILSILNQSFKNFELIISDDGSTDGSSEICKKYATIDSRIKYIRQPKNIGISNNMKFLLENSKSEYFMWAANDDFWHKDFIKILYQALSINKDYIMAFGGTMFIDQNDNKIEKYPIRANDFNGSSIFARLKKLIVLFDDTIGYGLFRTKDILEVEFPIWWGKNRICAYTNIYPTLVYYLSKGNFILATKEPIWFNRIKEQNSINHKVPYNHTFIRASFYQLLRSVNLVWFSYKLMIKAKVDKWTMLKLFPFYVFYWIIKQSFEELTFRAKKTLKGERQFF